MSYYSGARKASRLVGPQDYVYAISQPPIMGGMLGAYGKKTIKATDGARPKFIYNIQDFNPEQIIATGYVKFGAILKIAMVIDKCNCRKSDMVITVGRDLVQTLEKRFYGQKVPRFTMINNWINEKDIYPLDSNDPGVNEFKKKYDLTNKFVFMYSGNIGLYYDLEGLIRIIEKFIDKKTPDGRRVVFAFVGSGSVLDKLINYKEEHELNNVVFIPYQDKNKLIYSLNAADVHLCVNAKGIKGVSCPSKFYGIAGVAKPVLGVLERGSEIERLISEIGCGKISEPGDYLAFEESVNWFINHSSDEEINEMGKKGYKYMQLNLSKDQSISKYKKTIMNL